MIPRRGPAARCALVVMLVGSCVVESRPPPGASDAATNPTAVDSAAVRAALDAYYRDLSARDWVAFADRFWPGADITTVWRAPEDTSERVVVMPVSEFVAQAPNGPGSRAIFEERLLDARITVSGVLAQAWVRYRARFGDSGAVEEWEGLDAFTLMKHGDVWRIVELAFAPDRGS